MKVCSKGPIDQKWALVEVMASRWPDGKPLSEPTLTQSIDPVHMATCIIQRQYVNSLRTRSQTQTKLF